MFAISNDQPHTLFIAQCIVNEKYAILHFSYIQFQSDDRFTVT